MILQILQGLAQAAVRLDAVVNELLVDPLFQLPHHWPTLLLMMMQSVLSAHPCCLSIDPIDRCDRIQHTSTLWWVDTLNLSKLPARMGAHTWPLLLLLLGTSNWRPRHQPSGWVVLNRLFFAPITAAGSHRHAVFH